MTGFTDEFCRSCGALLPGKFCAQCGEKRITTQDYSIVHFFTRALEAFTHFDFRFVRSLKTLIFQPGELSHAFLVGRRMVYTGPIQLFLILNIVFALIGSNTFRTPLWVQEHDRPFPEYKQAKIAEAIVQSGLTRQEFTKAFDGNAGMQAKTWVFSMIPAFALVLTVLYGFRRYYIEHLVFATHLMAFFLMLILVAGYVLAKTLRLAGVLLSMQDFDTVASSVILVGLSFYIYKALRRAYGDGRVAAVLRAIAIGALVSPILLAYRFLLFFATLETMP